MNRYFNCIADNSSEGNLLVGSEYTALFDCGMMFCFNETLKKVKDGLKGRALDYIIFSHTHYDHIGALPFFKNEWNNLKVVSCKTGAEILQKSTPRKVIRELSLVAAKTNHVDLSLDYNDDIFFADIIVKENDVISLGDLSIQVIETPGHTRDSLSFFIPELELLILNETPGVLFSDPAVCDESGPIEKVYPCYLTSYNDTMNSIKKCSQIPFKYLSLPHRSVVGSKEAGTFFEKAYESNRLCRDFILDMKEKNISEEEMLQQFFNKYSSEVMLTYQPKEAFLANAKATIACTLRECLC